MLLSERYLFPISTHPIHSAILHPMCGRKYSYEGLSWEEYCDLMRLIPSAPPPSNFQPNYTIAPTHEVPVCIAEEGERRLELLRWGLVPHWAKEAKVGYRMINARAETLSEKPSFKPLLTTRRAIVAVSGFYEWKRDGKDKQAHKIEHSSGKPMMKGRALPGPEDYEQIPALAERGSAQVDVFFDKLDAHLEGRDFIATDRLSVADITAACMLDFERVAGKKPGEQHTNINRWRSGLAERDSFNL